MIRCAKNGGAYSQKTSWGGVFKHPPAGRGLKSHVGKVNRFIKQLRAFDLHLQGCGGHPLSLAYLSLEIPVKWSRFEVMRQQLLGVAADVACRGVGGAAHILGRRQLFLWTERPEGSHIIRVY